MSLTKDYTAEDLQNAFDKGRATGRAERDWVGLTYPDREALRYQFADWNYPASLVSAIEAKLKEKNNGA